MFLRVAICLPLFAAVACTGSGSGDRQERGPLQGFDEPVASADGAFSFRWIAGPEGQDPVEVQILEVTEVATGAVVYTNDRQFRSRDVNVAAWGSQPTTLLAYSGDIGTITIRADDSGTWNPSDEQGCLDKPQIDQLDEAVFSLLPAC